MQPYCSYLICATPHNGSTLLCEALRNTRIAGWPEEYFEVLGKTALIRQSGAYSQPDDEEGRAIHFSAETYADYLMSVLEEGTTPNGVFGAKIMWDYFDDFICGLRHIPAYRDSAVRDLLPTIFPNLHYVWVTRRNKVQQAVSLWEAFQRQTWKLTEPPARKLRFHFEVIDHLAQKIVADEADWWRFFDACGIQPFIVVYEELARACEVTVRNVLQYLQIPIPENLVLAERSMKRQPDTLFEGKVQHFYKLKREQYALG